jgi:hypothetical protein
LTGEEFCNWLAAMKAKGFNKMESGQLLGRGAPWVSRAQKDGADQMTGYACAAIYAGLRPFTTADEASSRRRSKHLTRP